MSCSMSIEHKLCEVKRYQATRCINQRFVFKNSGISCLALIFNLKNLSTTVLCAKKLVCRWRNTTSHIPFLSGNWYEPCWWRWVTVSMATWVRVLRSAETLCRFGHFAWNWACQWLARTLFILLRSLKFFFPGFRQWRSCAARPLILGITESPNRRIAEALILTESRIARRDSARFDQPLPAEHGRGVSDTQILCAMI